MKTRIHGLIAAAVGAALLAPLAAGAADSGTWLQRQFSTVHLDPDAPSAGAMAATARQPEGAGHAYAEAWLQRQLAGEAPVIAHAEGLAGRTGPIDSEDMSTPLSEAWLRHQFTTDHPSPGNRN